MSKKKKYILLLLITLVLAAVTASIYIFVNSKINGSTIYTVDKYSDVTNRCDTNLKDGKLSVDCKALLINIDSNSCFEVQLITKDKELKDLTVCEKNDTLSYTNDVLGYKKLMPVDMVFTYTKEGILRDYSFNNVSFTKVEDTYVQSIVNEDIANLVTLDPKSTAIENSVDFCPRPETLPSYITEVNRTAYTEYFNKNIMAKEKYFDGYMYNWDDSTIRILFACDSAKNMGYTDVCNTQRSQNDKKQSVIFHDVDFSNKLSNSKLNAQDKLLKTVSLIYDSMHKDIGNNIVDVGLLGDIVQEINATEKLQEEVLWGIYKIYLDLTTLNTSYQQKSYFIESILKSQGDMLTYCPDGGESQYHNEIGKYFRCSIENQTTIYRRCNNLRNFISNE